MNLPAEPALASASGERCFHCSQPGASRTAVVSDLGPVRVCSSACESAIRSIADARLTDFYAMRTHDGVATPRALTDTDLATYGLQSVEQALTERSEHSRRTARMTVEGMRCAGCAWLVKKLLEGLDGVVEARINFALRRAEVVYDGAVVELHVLLKALSEAGYVARPYSPDNDERALEAERLTRLRGLGLSALLGMQVMAAGVALHLGDWFGMDEVFRTAFRWLSLVLTIPVLVWPARQFFAGARVALANHSLTMDVPIALGLALAFVGSVHATVSGVGAVYYDSIVMFVLLISGARYLELLARRRGGARIRALAQGAPLSALRKGDAQQRVAASELQTGDVVIVAPGEIVPADGHVLAGDSSVDQSILTGEARPRPVRAGERVIAGSTNHAGVLEVRVDEAGDATVLARLTGLAERASRGRANVAELADRVAAWFVGATLVIATSVALFWYLFNPDIWIAATVSVLVVTCPCALSLATPAAMTAALAALARRGMVPASADVVERLSQVSHVVIDKTGTLTEGRLRVAGVDTQPGQSEAEARDIAAQLEVHASHPVGVALREAAGPGGEFTATDVEMTGAGVRGSVAGYSYVLGSRRFIRAETGLDPSANHATRDCAGQRGEGVVGDQRDDLAGTRVFLVRCEEVRQPAHEILPVKTCCAGASSTELRSPDATHALVAAFMLTDALRPGARDLVAALRGRGIDLSIASGDEPAAVASVARSIGAEVYAGELSPDDKLAYVQGLQADGQRVAVLGDGVNDAPVLAAADLGIAVGTGAQVAHANADAVLTSADLNAVIDALLVAQRTRRIIKQNLTWAALYNVLALPAAAAGIVPPWLAAIGMSLSSLVVVTNALRIR